MVFKCHSRTLLLCFDLCVCVKLLSHFVLTDLWGRKVAFGFGFCYIWFWRLYINVDIVKIIAKKMLGYGK